MDLKHMLNDSASQRPQRLHTPQASYDAQNTIANETYPVRSSVQHSTAPPPDLRPQPRSHLGYPSPHQSSLTPGSTNASNHPGYTQSPGPPSQGYISRENSGALYSHNSPGVAPSPSALAHQPPTPGGSHQYQSHTPGSTYSHPNQQNYYAQSQSPHSSALTNGHEQGPNAQSSPHAQTTQQHQPQTPLGPPVAYNKISPQLQRPPSQGIDQHYRKGSYGSTGSVPGREYPQGQPPTDNIRAQSVQRQSISEIDRGNGRDRSLSVSPKTIPKPSPYRQMSSTSVNSSQSQQDPRSATASHHPQERLSEVPNSTPTPKSSANSADPGQYSRGTSLGPTSSSNAFGPPKAATMTSPSPMNQDLPAPRPAPNLKRNASLMSDGSGIMQQPRKRLRRDEIPPWARSARKRPPRFGDGSKKARFAPAAAIAVQPTVRPAEAPTTNGHVVDDPNMIAPTVPTEMKWEPTIANIIPEDDLCTAISRWIYHHIGDRAPPTGAVFEIEAKVGAICDTQTGDRIRLPVRSESITAVGIPHTKFESSMDMEQHKQLNEYLNHLASAAYEDSNREPVRFCHLRQFDDFFELSPEGQKHLNPALLSGKNRRLRVRKTTDKDTGQILAMIVKVRLDDLEVYNPVHDFDYRISISVECPWEGDPAWLIPIQNTNSRTRLKDRMSYRHGAIQVDLTQVSHEDTQRMEHELEVEVSVAMLQAELEKERAGLPSRFSDLVKSLVDNARLLCRQGSLYRRK